MFVTVAICTWNRSGLLDQTLAEMANLRVPHGCDWELLIVNNNCTDDTDIVINKYMDCLPIRKLFEPKPGQSNARNLAIRETKGELLIWTDDDVLVKPDWLQEYIHAARQFPEATFFGGPIHPWFAIQPPSWLKTHWEQIGSWWACIDHGADVRRLQEKEFIFGANMAFRTQVIKQHVFDPKKGHSAGFLGGNDETTLIDNLKEQGHYGVWIGTAPVNHYIPAQRLTKQFFWKRLHDHAVLVSDPMEYAHLPTLGGIPRWLWKQYAKLRLKLLMQISHDKSWLEAFVEAAHYRGLLSSVQSLIQKHQ